MPALEHSQDDPFPNRDWLKFDIQQWLRKHKVKYTPFDDIEKLLAKAEAAEFGADKPLTFVRASNSIYAPENSRLVRVFLSSTFLDMQDERDAFITHVVPTLTALARKKGVTLAFVDLRWGVTPEQAQSARTIEICLQQVQKCDVFVGLLGARYGWHAHTPDTCKCGDTTTSGDASADLFTDAVDWCSVHPDFAWVAERASPSRGDDGIVSVTELEAECGVFHTRSDRGNDRALIPDHVFAISAGSVPDKLQARFRERVRSQVAADRVLVYDTTTSLCTQLVDKLSAVIHRRFPETSLPKASAASLLQQQQLIQQAFASTLLVGYVADMSLCRSLDSYIFADPVQALSDSSTTDTTEPLPSYLLVTGAPGSGKSSLLTYWKERYLRMHPTDIVITHHVAASADTAALTIVTRLMNEVISQCQLDMPFVQEQAGLSVQFSGWLRAAMDTWTYRHHRRVVLVVDSIEQISGTNTDPTLAWIPSREELSSCVRIVLSRTETSTKKGDEKTSSLASAPTTTIQLPPLTQEQRQMFVQEFFPVYGKSLTAKQQRAIVSADIESPLYLKTLCQELVLTANHNTVDHLLAKYLGSTTSELVSLILDRLEQEHGLAMVRESLCTIRAARRGLTESELVDIFQRTAVPFPRCTLFLASAVNILYSRDGFYACHQHMRDLLEDRYLTDPTIKQSYYRRIATFFSQQSPASVRSIQEVCHSLLKLNAHEELSEYLSRLDVLRAYYTPEFKYELMRLWRNLGDALGCRRGLAASLYSKQLDDTAAATDMPTRDDELQYRHLVYTAACWMQECAQYEQSGPWFQVCLDIDESSTSSERESPCCTRLSELRVVQDMFHLAEHCLEKGEYDQGEARMSRIIDTRRRLRIPWSADDIHNTERLCRQCEKEYVRYHQDESDTVYTAIQLNALFHKKRGRYNDAIRQYRDAINTINSIECLDDVSRHRNAIARAKCEVSLADCSRKQGDLSSAREMYEGALRVQEAQLGMTHPDVAHTLFLIGLTCKKQGQYHEALPYLIRARQTTKTVLGERHVSLGPVLNALGDVRRKIGAYDDALREYQSARQIIVEAHGDDHPDYSETVCNIALVYKKMGSYAHALTLYEEGVESTAKALGERHPKLALVYNNYGDVNRKLGKLSEAMTCYETALAINRDVYGQSHAEIAENLNNIGLVLKKQGKYSESVSVLKDALSIAQTALGDVHPNLVSHYANLADALRKWGKLEESEREYRHALQLAEDHFGRHSAEFSDCLYRTGLLLKRKHAYHEALSKFIDSHETAVESVGDRHPKVALALQGEGDCLRKLGLPEQALAKYTQALQINIQVFGEKTPHGEVAECLNGLGQCHVLLRQWATAEHYLVKGIEMSVTVLGSEHRHTRNRERNLQRLRDARAQYESSAR